MIEETPENQEVRIIFLGVARKVVAMEMSWVRSVERFERFKEDASGDGKVGLIQVGGMSAPVYRLTDLLGLAMDAETDEASERIVIVESQFGPWGLMVDRVSQVSQIATGQIIPVPEAATDPERDFYDGVILDGEELILYLSPERLRPDTRASAPRKERDRPPITLFDIRHEEAKHRPRSSAKRRVHSDRRQLKREDHDRRGVDYGQIILFTFSDKEEGNDKPLIFGLSMRQVAEVFRQAPVTPVPQGPEHALGILNWHGQPVPILSLATMLGVEEPPDDEERRYLIVRDRTGKGSGGLLGFPVWQDVKSLKLPIESEPASELLPINYRYVRGVVELEDQTLVVPDVGGILFDYEQGIKATPAIGGGL